MFWIIYQWTFIGSYHCTHIIQQYYDVSDDNETFVIKIYMKVDQVNSAGTHSE